MASFKAPRIDGMHAGFYQKTGHVIGESLCNYVIYFINSVNLPEGSNDTILVLIPKVRHSKLISQVRLISLCNVAYKAITKTLMNRLKKIMASLVAQK